MNTEDSPRSYDLFKLVVTLILVIILIILLLKGCQPEAPAAAAPQPTLPATAAVVLPSSTPRPTPEATATLKPQATAIPQPSPTAAPLISPTAELAPHPTLTAQPTPAAPAAVPASACPQAAPSRLKVGDFARVTSNLNMRSAAGINQKLLLVNPIYSVLEIIGGPTCEPNGTSAYLWWQVKNNDGQSGWSAEARLDAKTYFLEPLK
jgi:hypothetical protein